MSFQLKREMKMIFEDSTKCLEKVLNAIFHKWISVARCLKNCYLFEFPLMNWQDYILKTALEYMMTAYWIGI